MCCCLSSSDAYAGCRTWGEFQDDTAAGNSIQTVDVDNFHSNWPDIPQECEVEQAITISCWRKQSEKWPFWTWFGIEIYLNGEYFKKEAKWDNKEN